MLWVNQPDRTAPPPEVVVRGLTLPALLDEACDAASRTNGDGRGNPQAFNQWTEGGWRSLSTLDFRAEVEALAIGLQHLGLIPGDRVALLMHSDPNFCLADMACLLANLVDVPIDLTQTLENILFVLRHSEAKALVISNLDLLTQILPYLQDAPALRQIIVAEVPIDWPDSRSIWISPPSDAISPSLTVPHPIPASACLAIPQVLHPAAHELGYPALPQCIHLVSLAELQVLGQAHSTPSQQQHLRASLTPDHLATIIYIPGPTGELQGVMLSHENLTANALTAFAGIPNLARGANEVVLSFLPLTHVFARSLIYGHIHYGHSLYFSNANRVMKHLKEVQPTLFATVPLLLEKIYSKGLDRASKSTSALERRVFQWALTLARQYDLARPPKRGYALQLKLADEWVWSQWRSLFGGRLKYILSGGAALKAELATVFAAAGVMILQGYGLTQTSSVVCYNRGRFNRAGTVGLPMAGAEFAIAEDGEILVRGPYVMQGYYQNPAATEADIDPQGWFHTGDLGAFTAEGLLQITGLKKALFKLSTGKYIAPQPIEARLMQSSLIKQAIVVGCDRKFCTALVFPDVTVLQAQGLGLSVDALLEHPCILALYQGLIDAANCHLPYWATVKRFRLITAELTVENGRLTSTQALNRAQVLADFAAEINALYGDREPIAPVNAESIAAPACPITPPPAVCPTYAQSLNPRLTT
jgi:long-chain acyl-CoA synthetase